jgi:acyl-CoA reductase-like NAD-dependent aldehyde dehydrogenase
MSVEGEDEPQDGVFFHPKKWRKSATGNDVAVVFPKCIHESMSFPNTSAEVWIEKGRLQSQASQLRHQLRHPSGPSVALVLSAGNVNSIGITDAIHKLFIDNQVVMIKHNPVNAYIAPFLRIIFDELFENGFLDQCEGGAAIGSYLCQHHNVDTIHITGSQKTHDLIVWGSTEQKITPICTKSISSELGNVTPVIILPSEYSPKGLQYLARNIAGYGFA